MTQLMLYFQNHCMEIRKLKEMEYEIVTSTIKGWEGEVWCRECRTKSPVEEGFCPDTMV